MGLHGEYAPSTSSWARKQAEEFEASGGTVANTLRGKPIIVLTTIGAQSGMLRKTALMRVEHAGHYAVVASKGGAPEHPAWYANLLAHPVAELQDGAVRREFRAHPAEGAERAAWWARAVEVWPDYDAYQAKTQRIIPILVLEPVAGD